MSIALSFQRKKSLEDRKTGGQEGKAKNETPKLNSLALGCTKPILRGLAMPEYFKHLQEHATQSDRLLANMLRKAKVFDCESSGEIMKDDVQVKEEVRENERKKEGRRKKKKRQKRSTSKSTPQSDRLLANMLRKAKVFECESSGEMSK